jgi:hypothetical protein
VRITTPNLSLSLVRCRVQPHLFAVMTISEIYTFSSFYLLKSFIYYVDNIESDTLDVSFIKMVKRATRQQQRAPTSGERRAYKISRATTTTRLRPPTTFNYNVNIQ